MAFVLFQFDEKQYQMIGEQHHINQVMQLLQCTPTTPEDEMKIRSTIWNQTQLAESHGFTDERSATTFVLCAWLLGVGFDTRIPVIQQILHSTELQKHEKIQTLENFTLRVCAIFDATSVEIEDI